MTTEPAYEAVVAEIRHLVSEELHLLGQEVEDSLQAGEARRLIAVTAALDDVERLLASRRGTHR